MTTIFRSSLKISKLRLFFVILIFPLVSPEGLLVLAPSFFNVMYVDIQAFVYIVIVFLFFAKKKNKMNIFSVSVIMFSVVPFLVTLLKNGSLLYAYVTFIPPLMMWLLIEQYKDYLDVLVESFLIVLKFWIYTNLICMFLYPSGMYYVESNNSYMAWIFGYKSSFQYYLIPALCFSWLESRYIKTKLQMIPLFIVCVIETFMSHNMTLVIGLLVLTPFIFVDLAKFQHVFNIRNYLIIVLVTNLLFIFMTTWLVSTKWSISLLTILGKSDTLSYRTIIWPKTLLYIRDKILFGYGELESEVRISMYGLRGVVHAHNQLLEIVFVGGLLLLILYFAVIIIISKKMMKSLKFDSTKILSVVIFVIFLMAVVEVFMRRVGAPIWFIIFLGYYSMELHLIYESKKAPHV